jgi:hypothetical protein
VGPWLLIAPEFRFLINNLGLDSRRKIFPTRLKSCSERSPPPYRETSVLRAAFFGSIVRGEMTRESDVDILMEFEGR